MKAREVIELLAARHSNDVFVAECKDGPTWGGGAMRLDAWAMRKSWANPCTWGYEVKIDRGDWLNDRKWHLYRDLVHEFYLVAPEGVIKHDEIPPGIGYIRVASTGTCVMVKKKAVRAEPSAEAQNILMQYVLQSRAIIDNQRPRYTNPEFWADWLKRRHENRELGAVVSKALAQKYERDVVKVRDEMVEMERRAERAEKVLEAVRALGIDVDEVSHNWNFAEEKSAEIALRILRAKLGHCGCLRIQKVRDQLNEVIGEMNGGAA